MPRSFRGYDIEGKLGAGGMSTLYLGIQKALNRRVAIKMLHPGLADDENFISRFEREAKTASGIGHRNIVAVYDFGVEDDVYYIVMELVQGLDMKDALAKVGRIPPEVVLAILEEVCYGLEAAHEQGVIHRDIKPSNVMLSNAGEVKIADFGLARQSSDISRLSALTLPGSVLGTPAYMSPEQAAGKDVDQRTDIYSLGVMAYELFTGEKPFRGASYSEIRDQIINHDPTPLNRRAPVTPDIEALVDRMLAKDPDKRFPSMRHVIRALEDCMETLDPTGGLIKHRRKYITRFAQDPVGFRDELYRSSISSHLDRGFYFKQMGLAKIDDAVREFRYVLFLDPDNTKASEAMRDLEKEAEESGVRLPSRAAGPEPAVEAAPSASASTARSAATPPPVDAPSGSRSTSRMSASRAAASRAAGAEGTRVLSSEAVAGATQVFEGAPARAGAAIKWWIPVAAVLVVAAGLAVWKLRPQGGPAGAIALATQPPGALVFVRGPKDAEFRPTGLVTDCRLEKLADGPWEVRVELAGHRPEARRVEIAGGPQVLNLALTALAQDGRFELATVPAGASVSVRRPGETEFRALSGKTPLTSEPLAAGTWEVQADLPGTGRLTRSVEVPPGGLAQLSWDLMREHDTGRIDVTSEPPGAAIRLRRAGAAEFTASGKTTPATLADVATGEWEVRVEKTGFAAKTETVSLDVGETERIAITLESGAAEVPEPEAPAAQDGWARLVIVPFADVYIDGRHFQSEARRTAVPLVAGRSHTIELRHPTFGAKTFRNVKVAAGDTLDLGRYDFKWGQVRVFCKPPVPADLVVDGKPLDRQTPYADKIAAGEHRFGVRKDGYRVVEVVLSDPAGGERRLRPDAKGEVSAEVPPDRELKVQFVLEKAGG
jgi:serine/threonine protein kinase